MKMRTVRVDDELWAQFKAAATEQHTDASAALRELMSLYVDDTKGNFPVTCPECGTQLLQQWWERHIAWHTAIGNGARWSE